MRGTQIARRAISFTAEPIWQPFVCRACLAQAARQLHTTSPRRAEKEAWWQRLRKSIYGDDKSKQAEESREKKKKVRAKADKARTTSKTQTIMGQKWSIAEVVDENTHEDYMAATTWDGLERIGSERWVREKADRGEPYSGFFLEKSTPLSNEQWRKLLHHITAEVLDLHVAGKNVMLVCKPAEDIPTSRSRWSLQEVIDGSPREHLKLPYNAGTSWMGFSLQDPIIKFAIVKRAMQMTGKRISDPAISNAKTLANLYDALKTREKSKKLAQDSRVKSIGTKVPNVTLHRTRQTSVHKEKAIGRWKVIEAELLLRDLPVFGTNFQKAKEGAALRSALRK